MQKNSLLIKAVKGGDALEEWKNIPGYEGIYEASTHGRIRTCLGKTTSSARFAKRVWKQRVLKQKVARNKKGRLDARVSLWKDGKEKTWLVARLVAMTWCAGYGEGLTVNHKDGNTTNNVASNLEWLSLKDNIRHGFSKGLYSSGISVSLKNEHSELKFSSFAEASRYLGFCHGYIGNRMRRGKHDAVSVRGEKYTVILNTNL